MELLENMADKLKKTPEGKQAWSSYVLQEAIQIVASQSPPHGNYPQGGFMSSTKISAEFLGQAAKKHDNARIAESMPFLHSLLSTVLQQFIEHNTTEGDESNNVGLGAMDEDPTEARGLNLEEIGYQTSLNSNERRNLRAANLRDMMHSIRLDTGATVFTQTHKNVMTAKSLNVFLQMANSYDILGESDAEMMDEDSDSDSGESHTSEKVQETNDKMKRVANSYLLGFKKIQKEIGVDPQLSRFKLHMPCSYDSEIDDEEMANPTDDIPRYEL
ncbi:hypothetical protein PtB15_1B861 [Puccinia triticina]|nr:hypothetical protein PtB15_1B861 [Puccinia triticina]